MSLFRNAPRGRLAAAAIVGGGGLLLTGGGVYAALQATANNTAPQASDSGTLKLSLADNGAGFTTAVANLAPGDVVRRYVDLTNGGTLAAQALTLAVADASPTKLTSDATNGLQVAVTSCSTAWAPTTGVCGGTTTVLATSSVSALRAASATLVAGALPAGSVQRLQVSLTLPDQVETTVNGVLPPNSIQGLSASLTWTFTESQRTATTTTS